MLSKRYESTEVDRRTWLHVPSGTHRRVKGDVDFISSGSEVVKGLRRRQYDQAIIERTIGLVFGPFTALYISFLSVAL